MSSSTPASLPSSEYIDIFHEESVVNGFIVTMTFVVCTCFQVRGRQCIFNYVISPANARAISQHGFSQQKRYFRFADGR